MNKIYCILSAFIINLLSLNAQQIQCFSNPLTATITQSDCGMSNGLGIQCNGLPISSLPLNSEHRWKIIDPYGSIVADIYKTSPYLPDTDSDTFSDKQEIESGNDPTCPQGESCAVVSQSPTLNSDTAFSNPSLDALLNNAVTNTTTVSPATPPATSLERSLTEEEKKALRDAFGVSPSASDLREFLLQAGMDKKTLDGLSDEQIISTFNEMIK